MPNINHTVLLKFQPEVTDAQITQVFQDLANLKNTIPGILDFTGGPNNSPEGLADGFTHGFSMIFTDAQARDAYLPHPNHESFKQSALPLIDKVLVFDYEYENQKNPPYIAGSNPPQKPSTHTPSRQKP